MTWGQTNTCDNQYTFVGTNARSHDQDGNLLSDGLRSYTWDSEGKLLSLQATAPAAGDLRIEADYDARPRRVERRTFTYQSGAFVPTQTTEYLYDGWNVIEERTADLQAAPAAEATRRYTWGLDLSRTLQDAGGVGGLLMAEELTATQTIPYYYDYDGNGNVTAITDSNGSNVATYRYTAFGKLKTSTGTYAATNTYRFSTKPQDAEVKTAANGEGLNYYGYRYYDAVTGRWPSRDPIGESGGVNLYAFGPNSPVNGYDYLGNNWFTDSIDAINAALGTADPGATGTVAGAATGIGMGALAASCLGAKQALESCAGDPDCSNERYQELDAHRESICNKCKAAGNAALGGE